MLAKASYLSILYARIQLRTRRISLSVPSREYIVATSGSAAQANPLLGSSGLFTGDQESCFLAGTH